jgi:hypothetical protein
MSYKYIAGFFEGEGTITTWRTTRKVKAGRVRGGHHVRVCIPQKNHPEVLVYIQKFLGYGYLHEDRKGTWRLTINNREEVRHFLKHIYPHMHARRKRRAARLAWQLTSLIGPAGQPNKQTFERRAKLAKKISEANH